MSVRLRVDPQWAMLACALPLAAVLFLARGGKLASGEEVRVRFTLITLDKTAAMCAAPQPIFGHECRYRAPDAARPDQPRTTLQPFASVHGGPIYLVDDLFAEPAIAARYRSEPPGGKPWQSLRRFEARCSLRLLGRAPPLQIRFGHDAQWMRAPELWVGQPVRCRVIG